jgi:hypothetical protein
MTDVEKRAVNEARHVREALGEWLPLIEQWMTELPATEDAVERYRLAENLYTVAFQNYRKWQQRGALPVEHSQEFLLPGILAGKVSEQGMAQAKKELDELGLADLADLIRASEALEAIAVRYRRMCERQFRKLY